MPVQDPMAEPLVLNMLKYELCRRGEPLKRHLQQVRRRLHEHPELGLRLPATQEAIVRELSLLPVETSLGRGLDSVTAVLRGARRERSVILRADMDALPVHEETAVGYASKIPGLMHACGHDMHVAALIGAAQLMGPLRHQLKGDVVLMFQPGEEGHHGAELMLEEGVLRAAGPESPPRAAYALHVLSGAVEHGVFSARDGTVMAASDAMQVVVRGAGGHASMPHLARDPIPVAAEIIAAVDTVVSRGFSPNEKPIVTIGSIHGGSVRNVIPDEVTLEATIRTVSASARERIRPMLVQLIEGIARGHGQQADVIYQSEYPATENAEGFTALLAQVVGSLFDDYLVDELPHSLPTSEDFSFILNELEYGGYFLLGTGPVGTSNLQFNHSPLATFDDALLLEASAALAGLAIMELNYRCRA